MKVKVGGISVGVIVGSAVLVGVNDTLVGVNVGFEVLVWVAVAASTAFTLSVEAGAGNKSSNSQTPAPIASTSATDINRRAGFFLCVFCGLLVIISAGNASVWAVR